jgi:hypothetical protein
MSSVTTYSGWVIDTLYKDLPANTYPPPVLQPLKIGDLPIVWDNGQAPDGFQNNTLKSPVPNGYSVMTTIYYAVSGTWPSSLAEYPNQVLVYLIDSKNPTVIRSDYVSVNTKDSFWENWLYGPPVNGNVVPPDFLTTNPTPPYQVTGNPKIMLPDQIQLQVLCRGSGCAYTLRNFTFQILIRITVTRDCTTANIDSEVCKTICISNPTSPACSTVYFDYCLTRDPALVATPVCKNYLISYINVNQGSNYNIDEQITRYCRKYDKGLEDFIKRTEDNPDDRNLCGCNISADASDIRSTKLYSNFYQSLVKLFPGFSELGYKEKCLFGPCANSDFVYAGVGRACNVPACIQVSVINNDGTIGGNVNVDQSCSQYTGFGYIFYIVVIFVVIVVVIVVLYLLISAFTNTSDDGGSRMGDVQA